MKILLALLSFSLFVSTQSHAQGFIGYPKKGSSGFIGKSVVTMQTTVWLEHSLSFTLGIGYYAPSTYGAPDGCQTALSEAYQSALDLCLTKSRCQQHVVSQSSSISPSVGANVCTATVVVR